jgi:hypothetical protein
MFCRKDIVIRIHLTTSADVARTYNAGLPDFSWFKIPKQGKYTKLPQNIPNGHKIFPMAVK